MISSVPRRRQGVGGHRRPLAAAIAVLAIGLLAAAPTASAAPRRLAATGGCRSVDGGSVSAAGGPHRATVVVDTGSGPVWSACISFSGSISGIEALERAQSVITDLDPVYDQYTGLGRAVCRLRGVGTDPPDCLGKSVDYWSYSHDGRVASVGAGAVSLSDGDVDGWHYGSGGKPRAATDGTEATAAVPATTTTTRPVTATTRPTGGGTGLTASTVPAPGSAPSGAAPGGATTTTRPGETTTTRVGQTTTSTSDAAATTSSTVVAAGTGKGYKPSAGAAAVAGSAASSDSGSGSSGGSALPSVLGFLAVLAAVGGGIVVVRRRRLGAGRPVASA